MKDGILANVTSWGLVFNSFRGLERAYLDHVMEEVGHDRVWAVGPLLQADDDQPSPSCDVMRWLDTCDDRTVIYVCFGTQAVLTTNQMEEIAAGLEKSGTRFIWCVKLAPEGHVEGDYGMMPAGFEDHVAGRGLVIKGWAPQVMILRHRAVGAFLTHCGWNSVLEGLVAGVPMLAWPMEAEQFLNASLLVDELKVAIRVCEGAQTIPDSDELARVVGEAVGERRSDCMRDLQTRAMQLRREALNAIKDGGSSCMDLDALVNHLSQGSL